MKARGLASPDDADALACTFAEPVLPREKPMWLDRTRWTGTSERDGGGGFVCGTQGVRKASVRISLRGCQIAATRRSTGSARNGIATTA